MYGNWNLTPPNHNSKVTVELRDIVESGVDLWDFEYPSYYKDEEKKAFEQKVIDHYYFRQIGQETVGRFKHYLRTRMREIMPYYIQRYKSCELLENQEDPLESYHLTETFEQTHADSSEASTTGKGTKTTDGESARAGTSSNDVTRRFSNTPQGSLDNLDNYLTEATVEDSNGNTSEDLETSELVTENSEGSSNASNEGTVTHTLTRRGNIGVQPIGYEINELRKAFLNVDMEIIENLNDLFLKVY